MCGGICYNSVCCLPAGRLVIILKGRHCAKIKSSCCVLRAHYAGFVPAPRSFRAYQSPLRYARGDFVPFPRRCSRWKKGGWRCTMCRWRERSAPHASGGARTASSNSRARASRAMSSSTTFLPPATAAPPGKPTAQPPTPATAG